MRDQMLIGGSWTDGATGERISGTTGSFRLRPRGEAKGSWYHSDLE